MLSKRGARAALYGNNPPPRSSTARQAVSASQSPQSTRQGAAVRPRRRRRRQGRRAAAALLLLLCLAVGAVGWRYPGLAAVVRRPGAYPASLVRLYLRNPETLDYLRGYPERQPGGAVTLTLPADGGLPMLQQWDTRWGYDEYGDDMLAFTGCGPTCLSMVAAGLTGNAAFHPGGVAAMALQRGYYVEGVGSSWLLMSDGAVALGLRGEQLAPSQAAIDERLAAGSPVICSVGPGVFTTTGHFVVLAALAPEGGYIVHDPNSISRSSRVWQYDEFGSQIRSAWAYTAA